MPVSAPIRLETQDDTGKETNANDADAAAYSCVRQRSFCSRTLQRYLVKEDPKSTSPADHSSPLKRTMVLLRNPLVASGLGATACIAAAPSLRAYWLVFFVYFASIALVTIAVEFGINRFSENPAKQNPLYEGLSGRVVMCAGVNLPIIISVIAIASVFTSGALSTTLPIALIYASGPLANLLAWKAIKSQRTTAHIGFRGAGLIISILLQCGAMAAVLCQANKLEPAFAGALIAWLAPLVVSVGLARNMLMNCKYSGIKPRNCAIAAAALTGLCLIPVMPSLLVTVQLIALTSDSEDLRKWAWSILERPEQIAMLKSHIKRSETFEGALPLTPLSLSKKGLYILTGEGDGSEQNYYAYPIVGAQDKALTIVDSTISTTLKATSMSADFECSLTLLSSAAGPSKEAKMEILLPPRSVMTDLQLFDRTAPNNNNSHQQRPQSTISGPELGRKADLQTNYTDETMANRDPVLVTMVSPDRILLQCAPLFQLHPTQVKLKFSAPLTPNAVTHTATVPMPAILDSNVSSGLPIKALVNSKARTTAGGTKDKNGAFRSEVPLGEEVSLALPSDYSEVIAGTGISRKTKHKAGRKRRFVIGIDASIGNAGAKEALQSVLRKAPTNICRVMIADPVAGMKEYAASDAYTAVSTMHFKGGDNNWGLLERAIRTAKSEQADVLWIHGAKRWGEVGDSEINHNRVGRIGYGVKCPIDPAAMCEGAVEIYDLQTKRGGNEVLEKIQASSGDTTPFQTVRRTSSLQNDIAGILDTGRDILRFEQVEGGLPAKVDGNSPRFVQQQHIFDLCAQQKRSEAESFAIEHKLLSPFTAIKNSDLIAAGAKEPAAKEFRATAIGPTDSTPVRVNNLATLEAILNVLANSGEIGYCCWGAGLLCTGLSKLSSRQGKLRVFFGTGAILFGLAISGMINWLIASFYQGDTFS